MRGKARFHRRRGIALLLCVLLTSMAACGGPGPLAGSPATTEPPPPAAATEILPPTSATTGSPDATDSATTPPQDTPGEPSTEATNAALGTPAQTTDPTTTAEPQSTPAPAGPDNSDIRPTFGVVAHLYYTDRARVAQLAENAGFEWIRQQVPWKDTERPDRTFAFDELDQIVESVNSKGFKLLLSVAKSPDFLTGGKDDNGLPQDPKDFGRFVEELATRYKGRVHAIEVWNEQNLAVENGGRVVPEDVERYVELLKEGYTRIKAVDPSIIVVAGALSSTAENNPERAVDDISYYRAMYSYNGGEIRDYMDVQGFHPAATLNPPEKLWPDDPGPGCQMEPQQWCDDRTHYFRHIEDVRAAMVESGRGAKKIWITEMGWATENDTPGYEYGNFITLEQQAEYLERALARIVFQYSDWVGAAFVWNLNFAVLWGEQANPLHEQASFGILNPDWSPRPSFTLVQGFIHAVKSGEEQ
jgi:polysaccharide biosynthesis protein PslG